jgi:putative phage-type endonuclease
MEKSREWHLARSTGIGGSDVAAILGLSKWSTALEVYLSKRGESQPTEDNKAMQWGRYLEPVIRQAYSDATGNEVRIPETMLRHPKHDFMIANLDGVIADRTGRIFEAKTARSSEGWGEPGTDQVPEAYLLQVQHYMEVTAIPVADIAVLIGGSDFRIYEVEADRELQEMIIAAEAEFWSRVQAGNPPDPVSFADVQAKWGRASKSALVMADDPVKEAVLQLQALRLQRAQYDEQEEMLKAFVMKAMGEADTLVDERGSTLCTWKAAKPAQRFDAAKFKVAHPDLYYQFAHTGNVSRRFLLK